MTPPRKITFGVLPARKGRATWQLVNFDSCKRGETSAKTGCTPESGEGGKESRPDRSPEKVTKTPWEYNDTQYAEAHGEQGAGWEEISPLQWHKMSKAQRERVSKDKREKGERLATIKEEWRQGVVNGYKNGDVTLENSSYKAKEAIKNHILDEMKETKEGGKRQSKEEWTADNKIGWGDLEKGSRIWVSDPGARGSRGWGKIKRASKKSATVTFEKPLYKDRKGNPVHDLKIKDGWHTVYKNEPPTEESTPESATQKYEELRTELTKWR